MKPAFKLGLVAAGVAGGGWGVSRWIRRRRRIDLAGKVVVITGGSRGFGLILARKFGARGASVAICARDEAELQHAALDLKNRGVRATVHTCDVTDRGQVARLADEVRRQHGGIDVLVNNAGTITVAPMEEMRIADYEEAMQTHFYAPLYTTLEFLPQMRSRGRGRIVNISSIGGKVAVPHLLPYCASKFALVGFSEGLRAELMKDNILVTTVCPGLIRTGSPRNVKVKGRHRQEYAWFSLGDALPLTSMDADRGGDRVVEACVYGEAEVVLSVQAKAAVKFQALFPGLAAELSALINRALPRPGGIGAVAARGSEAESALTPSIATVLNEAAARKNNEIR